MQEIDILDWIHGTFGCVPMDWLSLVFEYAFKTCIIWVILGILLLRRPNTRMFGLVLLCSLVLEIIFVYSFKYGFMRNRPLQDYAVDALITNFHLPESTLIMLVSALAGRENVLNAYKHAVDERYRFFSFGDAMFITDLED